MHGSLRVLFSLSIKLLIQFFFRIRLQHEHAAIALDRLAQLIHFCHRGISTYQRLTATQGSHIGRSSKCDMLYRITHCISQTFILFHRRGTGSLHISHNLLSLLVANQFKTQLILYQRQRTVTFGNNAFQTNHQHVVIISTLKQARDFAGFGIESPAQSFLGILNAANAVLGTAQIISLQQSVAGIFCISHHFLQGVVGSNKLAKVIVSLAVSFFAELNRTLDDSHFIFVFHRFFISHL